MVCDAQKKKNTTRKSEILTWLASKWRVAM